MARRRKHNTVGGRDRKLITNQRLPRRDILNLLNSLSPTPLRRQRLVQFPTHYSLDARLYRPNRRRFNPPRMVSGGYAPFSYRQQKGYQTHGRYMFQMPRRTLVCVRRKQRREVIFATGRGGRNRARRYNRSVTSNISC